MSAQPPEDRAERDAELTPGRTPEDPRHEMLCAYLLGELEESERAEIEAALEKDEELRAERARLESTIGVVRGAFPEEGLSPEALAALLSAATTPEPNRAIPPGWRLLRGRAGVLRVAAMLLAVVGVAIAARWMVSPASRGPADDVARSSKTSGSAFEAKDKDKDVASPEAYDRFALAEGEELGFEPLDQLKSIGYDGSTSTATHEAPPTEGLVVDKVESGERFRGPGDTAPTGGAVSGGGGGGVGGTAPVPVTASGGPTSAGPAGPAGPPTAPGARRAPDHKKQAPSQKGLELGLRSRARNGVDSRGRKEQLLRDALGEESVEQDFAMAGFDVETFGRQLQEGEQSARVLLGTELIMDLEESDDDGLARLPVLEDRLRALGYATEENSGTDGFYLGRGEQDEGRHVWTPEEIDEIAEELLAPSRPLPGETPSAMFFRFWGDNPFELTARDPQSTFAVDVDTASYALARRTLNDGYLPVPAQIRTEEFVNYFRADAPAPPPGEVFGIHVEMAPSLFHPDAHVEMLRITVRGKDVDAIDRQPLALTFVVDVSGSMKEEGRLELVKHALLLLVRELDAHDAIALIAFSKEARVICPMISASQRGQVEDPLYGLDADGGTNIEAGLQAGYALAAAALTPNAVNRVILLSDGVGNIGETDQERILASVAEHQVKGIYLNTIGVGLENHNDAFLEQLANKGDGVCNYVDSEREARRVMVDDFTKTLQPIARDVKIQVEFDPAQVESYRQLGYENRAIADADFRNDAVDAGEVNAGHQVTALYEVVRLPARMDSGIPLARVNLRYKPQNAVDTGDTSRGAYTWAETATERNRSFFARDAAVSFAGTTSGYRRAVLVAQLAEILRQSVHAEGDSIEVLAEEAPRLNGQLDDPDFAEFCIVLAKAIKRIEESPAQKRGEIGAVIDTLRHRRYEATRDAFARSQTAEVSRGGAPSDPPIAGTTLVLDESAQAEIDHLEGEVRGLVGRYLAPPEPDPKPATEDEGGGTVR